MKTYIALDLETTGFDPIADQVIEIAAIKFQDDRIIDTFDTLIDAQIPIPQMVSHITGIKDADLHGAPLFSDIQQKLIEFLGNYPIIGHNIGFDISFLNQKGMNLRNPLYDTLQLAGVMLPGLASYSLDTLSRTLKIKHEKKHRAYSDANACYQLFLMLQEKMNEIDPGTYGEIINVVSRSNWPLREVFLETTPSGPAKKDDDKKGKDSAAKSEKTSGLPDEKEITNFYDENSVLKKAIPDYELRPGQAEMSNLILSALNEKTSWIMEAGTGTGKTIAYLVPSVYFSVANKEKVVISTYTHTLQEQLLNKDLPLLEKAFSFMEHPIQFKSAVLKGRKNYISLKRLELFASKDFFPDHEVTLLIKILLWLKKTEEGDMQELSLQGKEFNLLDEICCTDQVCVHDDPEYVSGCYLMKARKKAEKADIVIVNHALLMQDAIADNQLIPEYRRLIVDEAHHLERVATDSLMTSISFMNFIRPFEKLHDDIAAINNTYSTLDKIIPRIEILFGLVGVFMEKKLGANQYRYQLMLTEEYVNSGEWQKIAQAAKQIIEAGRTIINDVSALSGHPREKSVKNYAHECERKLTDLESIFREYDRNQALWIFKVPEGNISIKSAPASVGPDVNRLLFSDKDTIILTSGTLRTDHSFTFIREQLSLGEQFDEKYFPSHFDYPDQVKVLIPQDLPEPATEGYFKNCAELIAEVIRKNGGRTLILFTAKNALMATYRLLAPQLKEEGFSILAQGITGGRGKIIEHFKDEPDKSAIFGTASFWEGIDIKGNALNCIILYKLPFDPPNDPIILTRCGLYSDSFSSYQLPRAILKFKQGFGRLIRSSKDTGSIIVLDPRIVQKSYGSQFLQSLPEGIKIEYTSKKHLTEFL
jgi:predicted DnaQ family exonuclease/DinG family helicase